MIHYISVTNYHSIREETVLDLRIPKTSPDFERFRPSGVKPDIRLPSVVVLMGPNGSGKTTLLRAITTVVRIACNPWRSQEIPIKTVVPFFSSAAWNKPTRFCIEFEANWFSGTSSRLFRYEVSTNADQILYEAFYHFPNGRLRRIFERGRPGEPVYVSRDLGITPRDKRLKAVRKDTSVIGTLAMLNVPLVMEITEQLDHVLAATNIVYHQNWMLPIEAVVELFVQYPDIKKRVIQEIRRNDMAIEDMRIAGNGTGEEEVLFEHRGLDTPVPLFGESGGTKRMFYLLPQIYIALNNGVACVIDEIDGDLHVDIVRQILQRFQSRETNPHNAQLFVTSHNVGVLDDIEKEELFIVEKGEDGGTRVHGVQDITGLRRDIRLYPKYRSGALGGLPNLG